MCYSTSPWPWQSARCLTRPYCHSSQQPVLLLTSPTSLLLSLAAHVAGMLVKSFVYLVPIRGDFLLCLSKRQCAGTNLTVQVVLDFIFLLRAWKNVSRLRPQVALAI